IFTKKLLISLKKPSISLSKKGGSGILRNNNIYIGEIRMGQYEEIIWLRQSILQPLPLAYVTIRIGSIRYCPILKRGPAQKISFIGHLYLIRSKEKKCTQTIGRSPDTKMGIFSRPGVILASGHT